MLQYQGIYYILFALLFIIAFFLTIRFMKRQESKELDEDVNPNTVKHKIVGNIGMVQYAIAFLVLLVVLLIGILYY